MMICQCYNIDNLKWCNSRARFRLYTVRGYVGRVCKRHRDLMLAMGIEIDHWTEIRCLKTRKHSPTDSKAR